MYNHILIPVDLAHAERLDKALKTAGGLAKFWGVPVTYVGVSAATPSSVAHTPQEFREKLEAFAEAQGAAHGITARAHAITSHDPATDLDRTLIHAVAELGADLVVMASHIPNITDYIWPSNGGTIASHSEASVFVVRDS